MCAYRKNIVVPYSRTLTICFEFPGIIPTFVPELTSGEECTHTHTSCSGGCRGDPACTLTQNNVGAREREKNMYVPGA